VIDALLHLLEASAKRGLDYTRGWQVGCAMPAPDGLGGGAWATDGHFALRLDAGALDERVKVESSAADPDLRKVDEQLDGRTARLFDLSQLPPPRLPLVVDCECRGTGTVEAWGCDCGGSGRDLSPPGDATSMWGGFWDERYLALLAQIASDAGDHRIHVAASKRGAAPVIRATGNGWTVWAIGRNPA
jgi:hypothetical protein